MILLPVIDLKGGLVVRGIAGVRESYRPIVSRIAADATPATVATAFVELGFRDAYVADLDAIGGAEPDWSAYRAIADAGLRLIVDAGTATRQRCEAMNEFAFQTGAIAGIVVCLEAIQEAGDVAEMLRQIGPDQAIFSVDLKQGRLITNIAAWRDAAAVEVVAEVSEVGYRRIIVLDLAAVGVGRGPMTLDLCRDLRESHPGLEFISGGGVRSREDVKRFVAAGVDRVLVASAIHDGVDLF